MASPSSTWMHARRRRSWQREDGAGWEWPEGDMRKRSIPLDRKEVVLSPGGRMGRSGVWYILQLCVKRIGGTLAGAARDGEGARREGRRRDARRREDG